MKLTAFLFILAVSICNICLNFFVKNSVDINLGLLKNLISKSFLIAFLMGTVSIICLLQVYRSQVNLAQGILLMGTLSIIGGSIFSVLYLKNKLNSIEIILLVILSMLFIYRWYLSFNAVTNINSN